MAVYSLTKKKNVILILKPILDLGSSGLGREKLGIGMVAACTFVFTLLFVLTDHMDKREES